MYIKGGEYLGEYSNNEDIAPITQSDNFGLDDYEPEFFLDPLTWNTAGTYEIALKFDVDDFTGKYHKNNLTKLLVGWLVDWISQSE